MAPPPESERVLIFDFGAQYGQLIARRVREQNVFCQLVRHDLPAERVAELKPRWKPSLVTWTAATVSAVLRPPTHRLRWIDPPSSLLAWALLGSVRTACSNIALASFRPVWRSVVIPGLANRAGACRSRPEQIFRRRFAGSIFRGARVRRDAMAGASRGSTGFLAARRPLILRRSQTAATG